MSVLLGVLLTLACLYVVALIVFAWISLHPVRTPIFLAPDFFEVPQEDVEFPNDDGHVLRGWHLPQKSPKTVAICAHGYVMNRAELTPVAAQLWKLGIACLIFEFRAHGRSGGKKSGLGWLERKDVGAAIQKARQLYPSSRVVLLGSSMGAAASAFAGAESDVDAIVLDSSYSRLSHAIPGWWRFVGGQMLAIILWPVTILAIPMAGFSPFKVDVAKALAKVKVPVLILHGEQDDLALPSEALRNQSACQADIAWFPRSGHTEGRWLHPDLYMEALTAFLTKNELL